VWMMRRRGAVVYLALSTSLLAVAGCREPAPDNSMTESVEEFTSRVNDYVALRNRLADSVGPLSENMTQEQIAARATALSQAILLARPDARQGDIFTPRAASVFGALIEQEYSRRPPRVREVREDAQDELPDFVPKVNQLYPTTYPLATFPPELLPLLPRLPEEVEYRVVNHYLLLRDVESNLIVDFMPRAVPVPKA
jgi:hypothetical protein